MTARRLNTEHIQVAATLRRMREHAKVSREEAASLLGCTSSKIGDLEVGRSKPKPAELERLLDHYGITGAERDELVQFARTSRGRRAPSPYSTAAIPGNHIRTADLEAQALSSVFYSGELIPGILQVRSYAEALLSWGRESRPDEVARFLDLRMERAGALTRTHRPPLRYWCILSETALRSNIGGAKVMREQIGHLIQANLTMENIVVQVLPQGSGAHAFLGLTIALLRFPPPAPDTLMLDSYGRMIFEDRPGEVARAAHHLELLKAQALGLDSSTDFLQRLHQELSVE
ncbi:helix-turn-helix domain-containing protein [Solihabitans fulvus]|uniref:Helix-turn-helix domain-containing protein n=1 Tax=Solihabitans fulvus TaxID=1892852 RepID=A0A5B2WS81_9PSEU|nr:helix-turn-helix transcriptional regulator [Solihabitans fulvus]KAA2254843.1 helix-turn-helix domain-containing protein [Solihabitans fulvus]